jgi:hypothetical protein
MFFLLFLYVQVQIENPLRLLNADMFATPSTMFELPHYDVQFAHLLAETPSPPPICIRPFNKLVLDFLDIEAEQGEDSDRHGNPSG